ncbi:MAG: zf-TFIIB domain-containing protein [Glaciimonas sp.]|nr:zf-TFIIB domain-containing protein [Glaciimonas sp.]
MYCPVCKDKELVMSERQSIEIDYCPGCRGVWLDRGELDKIIEKSALELTAASAPQSAPVQQQAQPQYQPQHQPQSGHHGHNSSYGDHRGDNRYRGKKKESFWKELFD